MLADLQVYSFQMMTMSQMAPGRMEWISTWLGWPWVPTCCRQLAYRQCWPWNAWYWCICGVWRHVSSPFTKLHQKSFRLIYYANNLCRTNDDWDLGLASANAINVPGSDINTSNYQDSDSEDDKGGVIPSLNAEEPVNLPLLPLIGVQPLTSSFQEYS